MEAGTLTPDTSTLVEVARRNLWFTLNRGTGGGGILGGVVSGQLLHSHHPGAAILSSTDLLFDSLLLGELVDSLLVVGGAPAKPVNAALKSVVPGLPRVLVLGHYFSCRSESSNIS